MKNQPYPTPSRRFTWRRSFLYTLAPLCVAVIGTFCPVPVSAQISDEARLQQIERQIEALQSEVRATRQRMSGQTGSAVLPPAEGPRYDGKDSKVVLPSTPEPVAERWRFFVGVDALVIKPFWSTNPAYSIDIDDEDGNTQKNFSHDFNVSPMIRAGVVSPSGLGFRASYWWMNSDANEHISDVSSSTIETAEVLGLDLDEDDDEDGDYDIYSSLDLHRVVDGEITLPVQVGRFGALFSGGVRYADIEQKYDVDKFDVDDDDQHILRSSHDLQAFGPTFGAEATYSVGGGLWVYTNLRGSIIFGERDERATSVKDIISEDDDEDEDSASASQDTAVTIVEVEGGLGWTHDWNRWGVDLRAGVVSQMWFNAGNASQTDHIIYGTDDYPDPGANLGLLGLRVSAGVHF